jgi:hypothetical protein
MDSLQQQVERLMSLNADTELRFDDGVLKSNSNVMSVFSSVLCNAIEAHSAGDDNNNNSSSSTNSCNSGTIVIPMDGVTKEQWLNVAPFWHPLKQSPVVKSCDEAELLLDIGSRFELHPVVENACAYVTANADGLFGARYFKFENVDHDISPGSVWKSLLKADGLHLTSCIPALVKRATAIDRPGCSNLANIQELSAPILQQLVVELAPVPPSVSGNSGRLTSTRR